MTQTTVYIRPGCVQCNATFRAMDKASIDYCAIDASRTPKLSTTLKTLGYTHAPVVVKARDQWPDSDPTKSVSLGQQYGVQARRQYGKPLRCKYSIYAEA